MVGARVCRVKAESGEPSLRRGLWVFVTKGQVLVREWNADSECLQVMRDEDQGERLAFGMMLLKHRFVECSRLTNRV